MKIEDKRPHPDERGTDAYLEKSEVPERLHAGVVMPTSQTAPGYITGTSKVLTVHR